MALALQYLAKLYKQQTLPLFYDPLYKEFIKAELSADKSLEGSKVQFAQVFPSFMENIFLNGGGGGDENEERKASGVTVNPQH